LNRTLACNQTRLFWTHRFCPHEFAHGDIIVGRKLLGFAGCTVKGAIIDFTIDRLLYFAMGFSLTEGFLDSTL